MRAFDGGRFVSPEISPALPAMPPAYRRHFCPMKPLLLCRRTVSDHVFPVRKRELFRRHPLRGGCGENQTKMCGGLRPPFAPCVTGRQKRELFRRYPLRGAAGTQAQRKRPRKHMLSGPLPVRIYSSTSCRRSARGERREFCSLASCWKRLTLEAPLKAGWMVPAPATHPPGQPMPSSR